MMLMRTVFFLMFLLVCGNCSNYLEDHVLEKAQEQLVKETTTEELVDLICSCRQNDIWVRKPTDCQDILKDGPSGSRSGRYNIYPSYTGDSGEPLPVWCDMETEGGGWTVLQRRQDGSVDFNLDWENYKNGFGYIGGEFWLGNQNIHTISNQKDYELRVEIEEYDGTSHIKEYDHFRLTDESNKYTLHTGTYTGTEDLCISPLGMEDGRIRNDQINASTEHNSAVYKAPKARLNSPSGSWYAGTHDVNQYIQVAFDVPTMITGVVLQGRYNSAQWVKKYKVEFNDGTNWRYVKDASGQDDMVFDGDTDQNTPVTSFFPLPIEATHVRIRPTLYTHVTLRFELLGCEGDFLASQNNRPFSTKDADNDAVADNSCAEESSAWWYGETCVESGLNDKYMKGAGPTNRGIIWKDFDGQKYSVRRTEMKIRPVEHKG